MMRSKQSIPKKTKGSIKRKKRKVKKKTRSGVRRYNLDDLITAAKEVQDGSLTTREAVAKYDLPYSTLHDRVTGRTDMEVTTRGPRFVLGRDGEKLMAEYFHYMLTLGIRTTSSKMKTLASSLAKMLGVLGPKRNLSVKWYGTFIKRWPQAVAEPEVVDTKAVNMYFTQLKEMLERHHLIDKPRRLFILDETEICIPYRPGTSAPFPDKLNDSTVKSDDGSASQEGGDNSAPDKKRSVSKNITLYGCGNALGKTLRPFFVCLSNLRKTEEVLVNCQGHHGLMLGKWKNSEEIFQYYLENHFKNQTVSLDDSGPVLLLFDAHKARPSDATIRWARDNRIILFPLPPHVHQLPDVGCMEHFKDSFEEECISFLEDFIVDDLVNRNHACNIAGRIYLEVVSPENLIACFRKIGVYPFNPRVVDPNASISCPRTSLKEISDENDLDAEMTGRGGNVSLCGKKPKYKKLTQKQIQCSKDIISDFLKQKNPYLLTDQALREIKLQILMEEESPDVVMKKAIKDVKKSGLSMRGAAKRHHIPYKKLFEEMAKSNASIRDKQGYRSYTMVNLQKAMKIVKDKKMTCHTASKKFGVPYSTLHDRVVQRVNPDVSSPGPQPLIGPIDEDKLADFIQYMSLLGYRFQQKEVQAFVTSYAHKKKILDPGRALSEAWYRHFLKRHRRAFPDIDSKSEKPAAETKFVNRYFSDLHDILTRFKLVEKPELVFNVDEVEIDLPYKMANKLSAIKNAHLRRVTILACGNAQGESLPPYFIYRGQHKFNQCHLKHAPAGSQGRSTLSRHTSPEVLQRYLYEHLIPSVNEDEESPALVLFDAYKMKVTEQQIAWARDNRVILFPLPPGLRSEGKYNEVGCLQNFRQIFEKTFKAYTNCHPGSTVNKYNICGLAGGVYEDAVAPACLVSHFRRMGIVPFNPKSVDLDARYPNKLRRGCPATELELDEADIFLNSQNPFMLLKPNLGRPQYTKKRKSVPDITLRIKKSRFNAPAADDNYNSDDDDDDELSDNGEKEHVEEDGAFADVPIAGLSYPSPLHTVGDWSGYVTVQAPIEEKRPDVASPKMTASRTSGMYRKTTKVTSLRDFQQPAATEQAVQTITEQNFTTVNVEGTTMHAMKPMLLSNIKTEITDTMNNTEVVDSIGPISLENIKTEEIQECDGSFQIQLTPGGEGQMMSLDMATNIAQTVAANYESHGKTTQIIYLQGEADLSDEAVQRSLVQQAVGDNPSENQEVIIVYVPEYNSEVTL